MDVGSAVGADEESFELVEPGEGAFDDPAVAAKAGAVFGLATCDFRGDPAPAELAAAILVVVAAVGADAIGSAAWPADLASDRRHPVDERDQLGAVMAVPAGERPGKRDPAAVYEEVVLAACPAAIDGAGARFRAPFFAWM